MNEQDATLARRDELALRVGRVAMNGARLELEVFFLAVALAGPRSVYAFVGQSWSVLLKSCDAMITERIGVPGYRHFDKETTEDDTALSKMLREADELMTKRNHVVHSTWASIDSPDEVPKAMRQRRFKGFADDEWTVHALDMLERGLAFYAALISNEWARVQGAG